MNPDLIARVANELMERYQANKKNEMVAKGWYNLAQDAAKGIEAGMHRPIEKLEREARGLLLKYERE